MVVESDWKDRLTKIREEQLHESITEAENKQKAKQWAKEQLHPTLNTIATDLVKRQGIEDIIDIPNEFGGTLEFQVMDSLSIPVILRYSVFVKYSSHGVTGETRLRLPDSHEALSTKQPDILEWRSDQIIDDFLTKFNSWEA